MNQPTRKDDERLSLIARRTKLAVDVLREEGIEFTDTLFWAKVEEDGQVKFGDWHPFDSDEFPIVQKIWDDPWLECNAKLAAVGYKIVFGSSEIESLWSEFDRLLDVREREMPIRAAKLTERTKHRAQKRGAANSAGDTHTARKEERHNKIDAEVRKIFESFFAPGNSGEIADIRKSHISKKILSRYYDGTDRPMLTCADAKESTKRKEINKSIVRLRLRSDPRLL